MCADFTPPSVIYGVVYRGGERNAGERTWVTRAVVDDETLTVDRSATVEEWFDDQTSTRPTLTTFLADLPATAAVGLDFPFGLPEKVVAEDSWTAFVHNLPAWCNSPTDLHWRCEQRIRLTTDSTETRLRATDAPLSALSPFDERIVASTFHGIRDVLRPLVLSDQVRVPPMTSTRPDRPFAIEVYPSGTLVDLDIGLLGTDDVETAEQTRRSAVVDELSAAVDCNIDIAEAVREQVVTEPDGLESLVAAYAVYRNTRSASALTVSDPQRLLEGQVFI